MREYLNADNYANNVRMLRAAFSGPICVVEGDTDRKLYSSMMHTRSVRFVCVNGTFVEPVIRKVNGSATKGVIGIMDADFCHLEGNCPNLENLFLTDYHDIEMLMVFSNAFVRVITEMGSEEKIRKASGNNGEEHLRELLLEAASPIGALRWHNKRESLGLNFQNLDFARFIDGTNLVADGKQAYKMICQRSGKDENVNTSTDAAEKILAEANFDKRQLCCGHDLVEIMTIALRKCWGTRKASDVSPDRLSELLRVAYHIEDFQKTRLFSALLSWCRACPDYQLLAATL